MTLASGRHLAFPFRIGADGRTATPANDAEHVRQEVMQLILTAPGERPFRPEIGGGARRLVFEPGSDVLRGLVQARLTQAISRWLGHRARLERLEVTFAGEQVDIEIQFRPADGGDSRVLRFRRTGQ